jgi:hypothetical protein
VPEEDVGVALLSNLAGNGPVNVLSRRIVDRVLGTETVAEVPPEEVVIEEVTGTYRPLDMLDPEMPLVHLLFNVQVAQGKEGPEMRVPIIGETASMQPLGPRRFRLEGGLFDRSTALFDGDCLYVQMMRARRVAWWETANAFFVYAGSLVLLVVSFPAILVWRWVRRRRRAPAAA